MDAIKHVLMTQLSRFLPSKLGVDNDVMDAYISEWLRPSVGKIVINHINTIADKSK